MMPLHSVKTAFISFVAVSQASALAPAPALLHVTLVLAWIVLSLPAHASAALVAAAGPRLAMCSVWCLEHCGKTYSGSGKIMDSVAAKHALPLHAWHEWPGVNLNNSNHALCYYTDDVTRMLVSTSTTATMNSVATLMTPHVCQDVNLNTIVNPSVPLIVSSADQSTW
jgi:hypothetical protein